MPDRFTTHGLASQGGFGNEISLSPPRTSLVSLNVTDPPPIFSGVSWTPRGASLTLRGLPGRRHLIEASDGLPFWLPVTNVIPSLEVPTFRVDILDPNAAGVAHRLYRATRLIP